LSTIKTKEGKRILKNSLAEINLIETSFSVDTLLAKSKHTGAGDSKETLFA